MIDPIAVAQFNFLHRTADTQIWRHPGKKRAVANTGLSMAKVNAIVRYESNV